MDIQEGDEVLVNVAAFIASKIRHRESVPCVVRAVMGPEIQIETVKPYRALSMSVSSTWVDGVRKPVSA
jgi:hypothetical protein